MMAETTDTETSGVSEGPSHMRAGKPLVAREVRLRQIPERFDGKKWHYSNQPIVRLGDVGNWSVVRRADMAQAMPFVISRKDWMKLPIQEPASAR
jgi:hypothetical protein